MDTHRTHAGKTYISITEACSLTHMTPHELREQYARGKVFFRIFDKQIYVEQETLMRLLNPVVPPVAPAASVAAPIAVEGTPEPIAAEVISAPAIPVAEHPAEVKHAETAPYTATPEPTIAPDAVQEKTEDTVAEKKVEHVESREQRAPVYPAPEEQQRVAKPPPAAQPVPSPIQAVEPARSYLPVLSERAQRALVGTMATFAMLVFTVAGGAWGVSKAPLLGERLALVSGALADLVPDAPAHRQLDQIEPSALVPHITPDLSVVEEFVQRVSDTNARFSQNTRAASAGVFAVFDTQMQDIRRPAWRGSAKNLFAAAASSVWSWDSNVPSYATEFAQDTVTSTTSAQAAPVASTSASTSASTPTQMTAIPDVDVEEDAGPVQYVYNYPVIERIIEEVRYISSGNGDFASEIAALEARIRSQIQSLSFSTGSQISNTYNVIAQSSNIDELGGIDIENSDITGGTISGTALSDVSFSGTGTTTYANGIDISDGCFAIDGTCISAGGGGGVSLSDANTWSALQIFSGNASSTNFSNFGTAYFGGSATSTFDSTGALSLATPLATSSGGTGISSYSVGDILYVNTLGVLAKLAAGSAGQVLKISGGVPSWGADATGGGGSGAFATSSDSLLIYPTDTSDVIVFGASATTTTGNIFEVAGASLLRGTLTVYNTVTAPRFTATSTTAASTFPYASSTALSVSGTGYFGTAVFGDNSRWQLDDTSWTTFSSDQGNIVYTGGNATSTLGIHGEGSDNVNVVIDGALRAGYDSAAEDSYIWFGNFGLGTDSPSYKLDVDGIGRFTGLVDASHFVATSTTASSFPYASSTALSVSGTGYFGAASTTALTVSGLTSGRVPFITTQGAFTDSSGLVFDSALSRLTATYASSTALTAAALYGTNAAITYASSTALSVSGTAYLPGLGIWNSNGEVGIGTQTPDYFVEAVGAIAVSGASGGFIAAPQDGSGTDFQWYNPTGDDLRLYAGGDKFIVNTSGNVGIGTTTPWGALSIAATDNASIPQFVVASSSDASLVVAANGKVGIGTASPRALLDITKSQNSTTGLYVLNGNAGASAATAILVGQTTSGADYGGIEHYGTNFTTSGIFRADTTLLYGSDSGGLNIASTNTSAPMRFFTGGSTDATQRLTILSGGNIGIGTSTPYSKLAVWGGSTGNIFEAVTSASTTALRIAADGFATTTLSGLSISGSATSTSNVGFNLTAGCFAINGTCIGGGGGSGTVNSGTQGYFPYYETTGTAVTATSSLYISTSGNIGVGTTSPGAKLDISQTATGDTADLFYLTHATSATSTISRLSFRALDVSGTGTTTSAISSILQQNFGGLGKGDLVFSTLQAGALTEVMRATSAGYFGIGTSTPYRKLSVTAAAANPQVAISYDTNTVASLQVDSTGDLTIHASNKNVLLSDDNFLVCASGCPSDPTGSGKLYVETSAGIGTTTPAAMLTIETQDSTTNFVQVASTTAQSLFVINANGNIGVGTSTPFAKFTVGAGGAISTVEKDLTDGATIAIDWLDGNQQKVTLGGNRTITFSNFVAGQILRLVVCQDGTGSRTITWPAIVRWQGGSAPTLTTTADQCDLTTFVATNATSSLVIFGAAALAF